MTARPRHRPLTLALHPSSHGFAWVAFEGPFTPYGWGRVCVRGSKKNGACLRKITRLMERLTPETIVLEAFETNVSWRRARITHLYRAIVAWAMEERIDVEIYRRTDVQATFAHLGARTRHEIAEVLARQFWAFKHLLPKRRRAWDQESRNGSLFSAVALVVTHYQRCAHTLLSEIAAGSEE